MPTTACLLALLRIPAHAAIWVRVGAYDTFTDAVPYATLLAGITVITNLMLHAVLLTQHHRRMRLQAMIRNKVE